MKNFGRNIEGIFCYCQDFKMSWLEHFPIFRNLLNRGCGIRMPLVENFLKINKWGGRLLETWEYLQSTLVNTMNLLVNPYFFYIKHLALFLADFVFSRQSSKAMLSRKFLYSVNQKSEMSDVSHLTLWFCQNSMPLANQTWGQNIFYFFRIFVCFSL